MITDYQQYELKDGKVTNIGERMLKKMMAIPLPNLQKLSVLDIGCDGGFWCWLAKQHGAGRVLGLDRNRHVNGEFTDLISANRAVVDSHTWLKGCEFEHIDLGKQYRDFGKFDFAFMMSMYHHFYENCGGDHFPIWFWLSRHIQPGGMILWEGPMMTDDVVVQRNVSPEYHLNYNKQNILGVASLYFEFMRVGPALHEPTREVYAFRPIIREEKRYDAILVDGAGGASKAFTFNDNDRIKQIKNAIGIECYPGSLNVKLNRNFDWNKGYFRAQIKDVTNRKTSLGKAEWRPRWARFYPVKINDLDAFVFRFEGEGYPTDFVELLSAVRLRDFITDKAEIVC